MPCSSVNSFTSSVVRSAFARQRGLVHDAGADRDAALRESSRNPAAQPLHPQRLVVVAAQVFLEGHVLEPRDPLAQRMLLVGLPEEAGVVEAGPQHALVAVANEAVGIAVGVQHSQKVRRELALGVFDRKILLVVAHDRDQNFFRQLQKFGIEAAQDRRRPLGQIDHGVEQRLVFAPARAGNGASGSVECFANLLFSLLAAEDPGLFAAPRYMQVPARGMMTDPSARMRCPRDWFPARTPSNSSGTTSLSSMATSQRTGRTKRSLGLRQYMFLGQ